MNERIFGILMVIVILMSMIAIVITSLAALMGG
jgi:hypothetical protein